MGLYVFYFPFAFNMKNMFKKKKKIHKPMNITPMTEEQKTDVKTTLRFTFFWIMLIVVYYISK